MKKLLSLIFVVCLFTTAFAQVSNSDVDNSDAKAILDKFSKKMQTYKTMKFKFTYSMVDQSHGINDSKSGTIYILDDKYRLYIADQIVICDGETVWTHIKEANEVQITEVDPYDNNTPNKMLTSYDENYTPKLIKEENKNGKLCYVLDLTPKEAQSFYKVRVYIAKTDYTIQSSTIFDKNGTTYSYSITEFIPNVRIHSSRFSFSFEKYPDVTVIDMR